jgi:hypothetical protein
MAYYDALIAKWATLTPGTTAQKLAQINAITVTGQIPTSLYVTGDQILNCINFTEFNSLTPSLQTNILLLCATPGQLLGGSANTAHLVAGMILAAFPVAGPTVAALTALAKATVTPWWQANGYTSPITDADLSGAGGLV